MPEIVELLASPVHRFAGRPVDGPAPAPPGDLVTEQLLVLKRHMRIG